MPLVWFGLLAAPYIAYRALLGTRVGLSEMGQVVKAEFPRLLGLMLVCGVPGLCLMIAWYLLVPSMPLLLAIGAVILVKYLLIPCLQAVETFAVAGIVVHRLDGFHTLINAALISVNNFLSLVPLAFLFGVVSLVPQMVVLFLQGGLSAALGAFASLGSFSAAGLSMLEYTGWSLLDTLLHLPLRVWQSAAWVLVYLSATAVVRYSGIEPERSA